MLPPIFEVLKANPDITAIIGTNPVRCFRRGEAPQGVIEPYVTWFLVAGVPENNLSDPPPIDRATVQIDAWATDDKKNVALATAIRDTMEQYCHMTGVVVDEQEFDTRLYHLAMQFDWWLRR